MRMLGELMSFQASYGIFKGRPTPTEALDEILKWQGECQRLERLVEDVRRELARERQRVKDYQGILEGAKL